jgi:hypothetical protein
MSEIKNYNVNIRYWTSQHYNKKVYAANSEQAEAIAMRMFRDEIRQEQVKDPEINQIMELS